MRKTFAAAVAAGALVALAGGEARALTYTFTTTLGPEATGATGSGTARVVFITSADRLQIETEWSGLSGTTTVAHIHCCIPPGGFVGVAVSPPTLPGFPTGVTEGDYAVTLNTALASIYGSGFLAGSGGTAAGAEARLLRGLLAGEAYLNVHSTAFPPGEIRGFFTLTAVPVPAALGLFGAGLLGLALARRR
jgi:hypothetical protein